MHQNYNYIPPEISRKVITVEVFEFILKTDQENAEITYYSSNPYALPPNKRSTPAEEGLRELLCDDSSITGDINCVQPPEGYKFEKNSYWKVDTNNLEALRFNSNHKDWSRRRLFREVVIFKFTEYSFQKLCIFVCKISLILEIIEAYYIFIEFFLVFSINKYLSMSENGVCFFGKQYDIPVISTQDITHFLRSKSEILEDQLKTANDLLHGSINAFLLNWVLDKLKEIKLNKENSIDILLKLWNFLSIVLKSQNLSIESKCFSFQKYSFTVILSVSLSLATEITDEKELLSLISSIEENVSEVVASKVLPHVCYLYRIRDIPLWVDDLFSAILYKTLFSPESLINYINFQVSNSEFEETDSKISNLRLFLNRLMDSLTDISYHSNVLLSLPKFLEIAQNSLNRNLIYSRVKVNLNPSKMTYLTHMFLSEILKIALELPVKQDVLKYSIISDILELSENNKSYHKSFGVLEQQMLEILKKAFFLIENQEDNMIIIGWKLLNSLLKFDFELVLPYNQQLWSGFRRVTENRQILVLTKLLEMTGECH
ncbi:hypothetical protein PORY_002711 [Pneumocystis oryctolagi]|uniref:Uncharacterized protein n=1 Tax=Pneumocystis oryctolagi TaxID=42067 RepID=A0ACB7C8A7_9ASCO|nr:hypothetical protein PORY_002711 [Pneumocystis oryctolagi]